MNETGFLAPSEDAYTEKIKYFLALLCTSNQDHINERLHDLTSLLIVIQGIQEIMQLYLFRELLWIALLQSINGLDNNMHFTQVKDLFSKDICQ